MTLRSVFADLHVHIGRSDSGQPVKISGSKSLTFRSIAHEASQRKGIGLIGIIDCHSPAVQADIRACLDAGEMTEISGGGIQYRDTTLLLGAEMEVRDEGGGPYHLLGYLPDLRAMEDWTEWLKPRVTNVNLSSQRVRATGLELQQELLARGGMLAPAHVFTPHRGLLGCSADRLADRLDLAGIAAVELGLSADAQMAGRLSELDRYPLLTNSDAHSTGMIGRECNELLIGEPSFEEFRLALEGQSGRRLIANYGLHPQLGKYHLSYCLSCSDALPSEDLEACPSCGGSKLVRGVAGRVDQLADREAGIMPPNRAPYRPQVPLGFFPGVGPAMREKLLTEVGTEMDVLHRANESALAAVAGERIASLIVDAREGRMAFTSGAGGAYGRIGRA
ncbi:endonuclease Q family protein [Cohnella yongneupensis]|uniref:Endonuclease Q family protein n=1 Tax=Cohnella yongneupensis TaxID=425006 RepID=A0ABW0R4N0_9BACL